MKTHKVRHCHECKKNVYLVETEDELNKKIESGLCTAFYNPELGYAIVGMIAIDRYSGERKTYQVDLCLVEKLTKKQIIALKTLLELSDNYLKIKANFEGSGRKHILECFFEEQANSLVASFESVGLKCEINTSD